MKLVREKKELEEQLVALKRERDSTSALHRQQVERFMSEIQVLLSKEAELRGILLTQQKDPQFARGLTASDTEAKQGDAAAAEPAADGAGAEENGSPVRLRSPEGDASPPRTEGANNNRAVGVIRAETLAGAESEEANMNGNGHAEPSATTTTYAAAAAAAPAPASTSTEPKGENGSDSAAEALAKQQQQQQQKQMDELQKQLRAQEELLKKTMEELEACKALLATEQAQSEKLAAELKTAHAASESAAKELSSLKAARETIQRAYETERKSWHVKEEAFEQRISDMEKRRASDDGTALRCAKLEAQNGDLKQQLFLADEKSIRDAEMVAKLTEDCEKLKASLKDLQNDAARSAERSWRIKLVVGAVAVLLSAVVCTVVQQYTLKDWLCFEDA